MRKSVVLFVSAVLTIANFAYFAATPAMAQTAEAAAVAGRPLFSADNKRVGTIYRVGADGSAQLIVNGKMVSVPAATISASEGRIQTSLTRKQAVSAR